MRALPMGTAFHPAMTPLSLFGAAQLIEDEHPDEADDLRAFAVDLAAIRNLPELKSNGGNLDTLRKYT